MQTMVKLLKYFVKIFSVCLECGFIVSIFEKKKGWCAGHQPFGIYEKYLKRPLDFGLSIFALLFLWPVMLFVAILVRINLGSPVLFKQYRPGLGGKIFTIRKYRTMRNGEGDDEERLTDFGKKLRSASLDEMPEFVNILRGDMSIIGPRPLLVEYLNRYNEKQKHRHDVRPGLTGMAQVSGRNELSWDEKFEDDVKYVKKITFLGDMKILFKTIAVVIGKKGINSKTSKTMERFTGSGK